MNKQALYEKVAIAFKRLKKSSYRTEMHICLLNPEQIRVPDYKEYKIIGKDTLRLEAKRKSTDPNEDPIICLVTSSEGSNYNTLNLFDIVLSDGVVPVVEGTLKEAVA